MIIKSIHIKCTLLIFSFFAFALTVEAQNTEKEKSKKDSTRQWEYTTYTQSEQTEQAKTHKLQIGGYGEITAHQFGCSLILRC